MADIIDMPKLSDTMSVGTLIKWLKSEGDEISNGDMLCEVETDKATMEVESFFDGVLLKRYAGEGAQVPIGGAICAIGEAGEEAPAAPAGSDAPAAATQTVEEAPPAETPKQETATVEASPAPVTTSTNDGRLKASPLAKKIAADTGVPLEGLSGSGTAGRIVKKDVLAAAEKGITATSAAPAAAQTFAAPTGGAIAEEKAIPVSNMRKVIASRLLESKTQVPHFYLETEVDMAPLLKLRSELNKNLADLPPEQGGIKFTVNDFILKASAEALRRVPAVNASWMGDTVQQHGSVHMSFGVALEDGLVTPVITDAHAKGLRQISAEAKELIGKARSKKLKPNEMSGSTFTVTNLGMYGMTGFYGIINMPNAAILSVGATVKKPVVDANDNIVIGHRMNVGMSGDHRVVDGATGAEFLVALKSILETPSLMLI